MPNNAAGPFSFWEQLQDWYPAQDPYGFAPQPIQRSGPMGPPVPAGARAEERTFTPMPVGHSEEWLRHQDLQAIFGDAMAASRQPTGPMGPPVPASARARGRTFSPELIERSAPMGPPVPDPYNFAPQPIERSAPMGPPVPDPYNFAPQPIERSAPMGPPVPAAAREAADWESLARWTPQAEATQQGPYFDPAQAEVLTLSPEAQSAYNQQLLAEHSGRGLDPMSVEAAQAREYDRSVQLAQQIRQARAEDPAPKKRATSKKGRRSKKKEQEFRPITPDWAKETAPKKKVAKKGKGKSKRKAKEWQPETPAWAKEPARPRIADMFLAMPQSVSAPLPPASGPQMMRGGPVRPR